MRNPKPGKLTLDVGDISDANRLNIRTGPRSAMQTRGGNGLTPIRPPQTATSAGLMPPTGEPWQGNPGLRSPGLPPGQPYSSSTCMPIPTALKQAPIEVSTILPSFLYLGPEISSRRDVDTLLALGIRRVLNVALECDDDEGLGLRTSFERYFRIPMKDSVEESGVGKGIRDACDILGEFSVGLRVCLSILSILSVRSLHCFPSLFFLFVHDSFSGGPLRACRTLFSGSRSPRESSDGVLCREVTEVLNVIRDR